MYDWPGADPDRARGVICQPAWEGLSILLEEQDEVARKREVCASQFRLLPLWPKLFILIPIQRSPADSDSRLLSATGHSWISEAFCHFYSRYTEDRLSSGLLHPALFLAVADERSTLWKNHGGIFGQNWLSYVRQFNICPPLCISSSLWFKKADQRTVCLPYWTSYPRLSQCKLYSARCYDLTSLQKSCSIEESLDKRLMSCFFFFRLRPAHWIQTILITCSSAQLQTVIGQMLLIVNHRTRTGDLLSFLSKSKADFTVSSYLSMREENSLTWYLSLVGEVFFYLLWKAELLISSQFGGRHVWAPVLPDQLSLAGEGGFSKKQDATKRNGDLI